MKKILLIVFIVIFAYTWIPCFAQDEAGKKTDDLKIEENKTNEISPLPERLPNGAVIKFGNSKEVKEYNYSGNVSVRIYAYPDRESSSRDFEAYTKSILSMEN